MAVIGQDGASKLWMNMKNHVAKNCYTKSETDAKISAASSGGGGGSASVSYGTTDLIPGESDLADGALYFVYVE